MKKILSLLIILWAPGIYASDWSSTGIAMEASWQALNIMDRNQTMHISESCHSDGKFRETNPLLGQCPGNAAVNRHFIATGLGHLYISDAIPKKYRSLWQIGTIIGAGLAVGNNKRIGLSWRF